MANNIDNIIIQALEEISIAEGMIKNAEMKYRSSKNLLQKIVNKKTKTSVVTDEQIARYLFRKNVTYIKSS
jgi:hypothetical protein